jgi:hypothetical protein
MIHRENSQYSIFLLVQQFLALKARTEYADFALNSNLKISCVMRI